MTMLTFQICGGDKPYMGPEHLEREHERIKSSALNTFLTTRKMGGSEFSQTYAEQLDSELSELYSNFVKHNDSKNIFAAARTPAVLFTVMVACYIIAGILGILGLEWLANLVNLSMGVALVLLITWAYARYSGDYREIGSYIDKGADALWDGVSIYQSMINVSIKIVLWVFVDVSI